MKNLPPVRDFVIPENELQEGFVRSSGPGGQNVNKTSTQVQLRWNIAASAAFSDQEKALIMEAVGKDEILIREQSQRSQPQNRVQARERLYDIIHQALMPQAERVPTKPTRSSKKRRLEEKIRHAKIKAQRRPPRERY